MTASVRALRLFTCSCDRSKVTAKRFFLLMKLVLHNAQKQDM
jgi:hypothetical protein